MQIAHANCTCKLHMQIAQKIKIDTNIHACVKAVLGLSFKSATDKYALK